MLGEMEGETQHKVAIFSSSPVYIVTLNSALPTYCESHYCDGEASINTAQSHNEKALHGAAPTGLLESLFFFWTVIFSSEVPLIEASYVYQLAFPSFQQCAPPPRDIFNLLSMCARERLTQ